ncbi:LysE family translocator [Solicola gregarius]|uniref:LysE family translocator n=1 Tax=Solicola gregarius TaxID=2908642 RepID=A0AA46TI47_9ACTN|nr:LysE family translocator [Solicola gregarius]UYM05782.1 LysE family translocator [Solicola gregarius]
MVTFASVVGVAIIAFGMVITPGPNMMYLVSRSISQGRTAGLISLAGVVTGFALYVIATTAGLSVLFSTVPALFIVVKVAGALYLLYLAVGIVRGGRPVFRAGEARDHSRRRLYVMGLTTCLLNPKIALIYAALLPQFVDPDRGSVPLQIVVLGLVQITVAALVNAGWVLAAAAASGVLQRSRTADRVSRWVAGTLLGGFAVRLGLSQPAQ